MTDPRIEAAVHAGWQQTTQFKGGMSFAEYQEKEPYAAGELRKAFTAAIRAADAVTSDEIVEAGRFEITVPLTIADGVALLNDIEEGMDVATATYHLSCNISQIGKLIERQPDTDTEEGLSV